jgi:hypothetical protein
MLARPSALAVVLTHLGGDLWRLYVLSLGLLCQVSKPPVLARGASRLEACLQSVCPQKNLHHGLAIQLPAHTAATEAMPPNSN